MAKRVTEAEVMAAPWVPFTDTWHPTHHSLLLDALAASIYDADLEVMSKEFSMTKNGMDMFVTMILAGNGEDKRWMLGARNSMQMSYAVGVCAGLHITVCTNMVFTGEFVEFRKHTKGLDSGELERLAGSAIGTITTELPKLTEWHQGLREAMLPEHHFKVLTFEAMRQGALPPSQFNHFLTHYDEEREVNDSPGTLYDFHGAGTRAMRNSSLFRVSDRNQALNRVVNNYRPKEIAPVSQWRTAH